MISYNHNTCWLNNVLFILEKMNKDSILFDLIQYIKIFNYRGLVVLKSFNLLYTLCESLILYAYTNILLKTGF